MPNRESPRPRRKRPVMLFVALGGAVLPCHADVITDWDAKASAVASPASFGEREVAIVDLAMFDAVNSSPESTGPIWFARTASAVHLRRLPPRVRRRPRSRSCIRRVPPTLDRRSMIT